MNIHKLMYCTPDANLLGVSFSLAIRSCHSLSHIKYLIKMLPNDGVSLLALVFLCFSLCPAYFLKFSIFANNHIP